MPSTVNFTRLHPDARRPVYGSLYAAGADLCSLADVSIEDGQHAIIYTGIAIELPEGFHAEVRGRSGLASRGIQCHVGTIDNDYRGEIKVVLFNLSGNGKPYKIEKGDRIAQIVLQADAPAFFVEVESLNTTERADGGFGSTGR